MNDAVRLNAEQFRFIYEESFRTWARLYLHVVENPKLPAHVLSGLDVSQQQAFLPRNLSLKHDKRGALATGVSIWGSTGTDCGHRSPSFRQPVHIRVAARDPISLSISETGEGQSPYTSCFARDDDYLALLILAWTYILSARWTEIMPGTCSLAYTESQATHHKDLTERQDEHSFISIHTGNVSPEEARWWAAILAPGQGWQANMMLEQDTSLSPWSIHLQPSPPFVLLHTTNSLPSSHPAASFSDASGYLTDFCMRHNIIDQSYAALSAVLLLPSMGNLKTLRLPTPRVSHWMIAPDPTLNCPDGELQRDWMHQDHIDKLLTLSCNTRGIRPMLLSAFYEPSIECNAITPWLQGALAAIGHLAGTNSYIAGRMCMERAPKVAFLWLGCLILGLQEKLLREVRFGQIPIDLHSAVWSGMVQSFLQQRVSRPLVTSGCVSRADECRLLFLSQSGHHARTPVCQWKPFGTTPVEDVDLEVRVHEGCEGHQLQYEGILWGCKNDNFVFQPSQEADSQNLPDRLLAKAPANTESVPVYYEALDRDREAISENATRNIFGWLRFDGYARHEGEIWKHEWFDMSDSDEDDMSGDETTSDGSPERSSRVETWLSDVNSSTSDVTVSL
ncbi:hypothetical protein AK830_g11684 [Neonectria ditissima]|uniref:Uncharacterized protein n=1 Tax=Neonectria ditissima TaxID=78410 RepID=A0A0P7B0S2_9HYPO|nr:hypothetical protein AK830_g11684 [Neonectria ditissima]